MYSEFQSVFQELGLQLNDQFAYGIVRGFETNAVVHTKSYEKTTSPIVFHISFYANNLQRINIVKILSTELPQLFRRSFSMSIDYRFTAYGLTLGFCSSPLTKILQQLPNIMDLVYNVLVRCDAKDYRFCPVCGESIDDLTRHSIEYHGFTVHVHSDCAKTIHKLNLDKAEPERSPTPNRYLKGFCGALIGALCTMLVYTLLSMSSYFTCIIAFVGVEFSCYLYRKFGGKQDCVMAFIIGTTMIISTLLSVLIAFFIMATLSAAAAGITLDPLSAFVTCMSIAEFQRSFYLQLFLSLLCAFIGIVTAVLPKCISKRTHF